MTQESGQEVYLTMVKRMGAQLQRALKQLRSLDVRIDEALTLFETMAEKRRLKKESNELREINQLDYAVSYTHLTLPTTPYV